MKTSVTRKKEKRSPHHRYEDLGDEEKREKKSSTRYEDLSDEKKGEEKSSTPL